MAKKAKEILLAAGYTEEELKSLTLLNDSKFCTAIEAESAKFDTADAERARLEGVLDSGLNWYQTHAAPALKKATDDAIAAKSEAAALSARLKAMTDYGLTKGAEGAGHAATNPNPTGENPPNPGAVDPNTGKYITQEQLDQILGRSINQVGDIMQMVADIPHDHRDLFGVSLPGGVAGLRKSYREACERNRFRGSIQDYWEFTYKVPDKRAEVAKTTHQKELDDYAGVKVAEERTRMASEYGNPMTRPLSTSRNPFTNRGTVTSAKPGEATTGAGVGTGAGSGKKQPWDVGSPEERQQNRIANFVKRQAEKAS